MPEMPEVEGLVQFLREQTAGARVLKVEVGSLSALKTYSPLPADLVGAKVTDVVRHGKWVDLVLEVPVGGERHLVFHLARTGWLRWRESVPAAPLRPNRSPVALRVHLTGGTGFALTEIGTRKRLAVYITATPDEVPAIATLGPEAFDLDGAQLAELLVARNRQLKGLLRDQSVIAGIGNAYSDEILHAARLSPFALSGSLDEAGLARLHAAMHEVLQAAVDASSGHPAAELKDVKRRAMHVHGRTGEACPTCSDTVREVSFADSSLQYCATCQTGGQVLADRRMSKLLR